MMKEKLIGAITDAAHQICGTSYSADEIRSFVLSSVSFPNKNDDLDGKPHDVEIRIALCLFHQARKRKRRNSYSIELISDFGLARPVQTPVDVAELFCQILNQDWDVRVDYSGILCLVTEERSRALRASGRLPCSRCVKWCKGEKGLWWHQQLKHGIGHGEATGLASTERSTLALIPYTPAESISAPVGTSIKMPRLVKSEEDVFGFAREGNLEAIQALILAGIGVSDTWDSKGALPLHWAAGSGQCSMVKFLVSYCNCDPNVGQRGKRSFSGRTPLHWAARNGHLGVVKYLVEDCKVMLDAVTADGTSAFGWACWQGHLEIMKYLKRHGCDVHKTNSFGCNAVLWCAQGEGNRLETMHWLRSIGCEMCVTNTNGHGALHKAAQRGRDDLVDWLVHHLKPMSFAWIGPDTEGCCPSDLAGMEGHIDLATILAEHEAALACTLHDQASTESPDWITLSVDDVKFASNVWEPWGGTRRLRKALLHRISRSHSK
jgi:hypothetical protein